MPTSTDSSSSYAFRQVDVFASAPLAGNPVAVVHDADGLCDAQMQAFANWTNLSETTFLCTPTNPAADYRLRIFTASEELPFAGHPTLGSAHAWLEAGGIPATPGVVTQECAAGLVELQVGETLAFAAPPLTKSGDLTETEINEVARSLGILVSDIVASAWVVNGPQWAAVQLRDAESVLALKPNAGDFGSIDIGVVGLWPDADIEAGEPAIEVRTFFYTGTLIEDPVTGSFNAGAAMWLTERGVLPSEYVAAQGTCLGRSGRVKVTTDESGQIWVGGQTLTTIAGTVRL